MISKDKIKKVRNEIIRREKELDKERIENIRKACERLGIPHDKPRTAKEVAMIMKCAPFAKKETYGPSEQALKLKVARQLWGEMFSEWKFPLSFSQYMAEVMFASLADYQDYLDELIVELG